MERKLFFDSYDKKIYEILKRYHEEESFRISEVLKKGNHYEILDENWKVKELAQMKMLLEEFPKTKGK